MAVDGLFQPEPGAWAQVQAARQASRGCAVLQAKSGDSEAASKPGELGNAVSPGRQDVLRVQHRLRQHRFERSAARLASNAVSIGWQPGARSSHGSGCAGHDGGARRLPISHKYATALLDATVTTVANRQRAVPADNDTLSASATAASTLIATGN